MKDYARAKKLGEKSYRHEIISGHYPFLPALNEILRSLNTMKEEKISLMEIPIELICGTMTKGRQEAFAKNYMPLLPEDSEFASKWINLLHHQENEGIRDPVKAYEFMGRFYISEGNKRVSILKYLKQPDILADVVRILPPKIPETKNYYEFVKFFDCTKIYGIYFSGEGFYEKLAGIYGVNLKAQWPEKITVELKSEFYNFSRLYSEHVGENSALKFGDAFMIYINTFEPESLLNDSDDTIRKNLSKIWPGHKSFLERLKILCEMI